MIAAPTAPAVRDRFSREARIGIAAVAAVFAIRVAIGNFVVNDWEGWGVFVSTAIGAAIEGLLLWGVVFGLVVRLAARGQGDWTGAIAVVIGGLAVLSLAIPYSAPQAVLGAGAVALGLVAGDRSDSRRSQWLGRVAVAIGFLVVAIWLSFVATTIVADEWPDVWP